uniref:FAD dependent oxidoreductase domain-containing protein n=1 Tax=Panagrolaimus sp. JU765 TaxID=591449 RepID=A0AC34R9F6_9BILA
MTEKEKRERFVDPSRYCVHFSTYASEGRLYVPWLKQQCENHGATFVTREIHSFEELVNDGYDIIMNCSGLHGGKIAGDDDTVYPLRGVAFEMDAPGFKQFSCHGIATFLLPLDKTVLIGTVRQKGRYDRTVTDEDRK